MNKELEELSEQDPFLEHLAGLKEHPGWLAYQKWMEAQVYSEMKAIVRHPTAKTETAYIRGKIQAYRLSQGGLDILIQEHIEKIKGAQER